MKRAAAMRWLVVWGVFAGCLVGAEGAVRGEERAGEFLEGLRGRGLYDQALEYLDKARTDPAVTAEFKVGIDYEAGVTLLAAAMATQDLPLRAKQLGLAEHRFKKFLKEHADHALAGGAELQRGSALIELGRMLVEQARRPKAAAEEKARLMAEARAKYAAAQKIFTAAEKRSSEAHKKFPKLIDPRNAKLLESRDSARKDLLQAKLLIPAVACEIGKTYEPGSAEYKKHLTDAANQYAGFSKKYRMILAGLYARLLQARCLKDLGDAQGALRLCDELLELPDDPKAFRDLKTKAVSLEIETCLLPEAKQYTEALAKAEAWLKAAQPDEESSPDGLAIRFYSAKAALELAKPLARNDPKRRDYQVLAFRRFEVVARFAGEHQQKAKEWLDQNIQRIFGRDGR